MASTIDFSGLTLNTEEARSSNELVFVKTWSAPMIEQMATVMTGVEMDKFIPIMGRFGLLGKASPGDCTNNDSTETLPTSEKTWLPKLITFRLIHCQEQIPNLLKFWKKARIAANTWEEVDGEMMSFIEDRAMDATKESILRFADFGDTTASPVGDATGNETLTVGTDKTFFNVIDGLWAQIFADQAGAAEGYRYTIAENALSTKALQLALADDAALMAMRSMYDNIAPEAFEGSDLKFQMTRSMFSNWQAFLEDTSLAFTLTQAETKDGVDGWTYRGIPIVVRSDWDRIIRAYHDLGTTYYLPHRIVLADLNNIPIGTSDEESFDTLKSHFDETTEKHYLKVAYKLDRKILLDEEIASAY